MIGPDSTSPSGAAQPVPPRSLAAVVGAPLLAVRPSLSLHQALPYVAAAYLVVAAIVVIYVAIMARKQRRLVRQMAELAAVVRAEREVSSIDELQGRRPPVPEGSVAAPRAAEVNRPGGA